VELVCERVVVQRRIAGAVAVGPEACGNDALIELDGHADAEAERWLDFVVCDCEREGMRTKKRRVLLAVIAGGLMCSTVVS
jgi:hypothetical protein